MSIRPKLKRDAEALIRSNLTSAISAVQSFGFIYQSCLNCEHFDEENGEICKISNNQRPPARIIAYSCEQWQDYEIPF